MRFPSYFERKRLLQALSGLIRGFQAGSFHLDLALVHLLVGALEDVFDGIIVTRIEGDIADGGGGTFLMAEALVLA